MWAPGRWAGLTCHPLPLRWTVPAGALFCCCLLAPLRSEVRRRLVVGSGARRLCSLSGWLPGWPCLLNAPWQPRSNEVGSELLAACSGLSTDVQQPRRMSPAVRPHATTECVTNSHDGVGGAFGGG